MCVLRLRHEIGHDPCWKCCVSTCIYQVYEQYDHFTCRVFLCRCLPPSLSPNMQSHNKENPNSYTISKPKKFDL